MNLRLVLLSILIYSLSIPRFARADEWKQYQPRPWPKVTVETILQPVNEKAGSDVGSVVNVLEKRKAVISDKQCNKKTEYGNWIPVHCGSGA